VAARLGEPAKALRYFRDAAAIDLSDSLGPISGGVHIATQGGLWMMAVLGFAGLSFRDDGLVIEPHLPPEWRSLVFRVQWRGRRVKIGIKPAARSIEATLESGSSMRIFVRAESHMLQPGQSLHIIT
jgi:trehalose/maltose hydrolase-like predicted phosphorylase